MQPSTTTPPRISEPTEQQRDSTAYFFLRLRTVYGAEYLRHFPDEESVRLAKREWFEQIGQYSREDIDRAFAHVKHERIRGSDQYTWLEIGAVLAILGASTWQTAAHKPFEQLALPDKAAQERARVAGRRALDDMKSLFGTAVS